LTVGGFLHKLSACYLAFVNDSTPNLENMKSTPPPKGGSKRAAAEAVKRRSTPKP